MGDPLPQSDFFIQLDFLTTNSMIQRNPDNDSYDARWKCDVENLITTKSAATVTAPLMTIFAVPKPFNNSTSGSVDLIQRNAIRSWACLHPQVEVLLIGDESGIKETADELGVRHVQGLKSNSRGTPLLSSAFELAYRETTSPILAYCNSDVILFGDFQRSIERIELADIREFVAFGRRTDLQVSHEIDFQNRHDVETLLSLCQQQGRPSSIVCKEYFVFNRDLFKSIPEFAVGRGNWDNWMIQWAKNVKQVPVIDISKSAKVLHQSHDYSHTGKGRWNCYVSGHEAQENMRLAAGRHLISGSAGNSSGGQSPPWSAVHPQR